MSSGKCRPFSLFSFCANAMFLYSIIRWRLTCNIFDLTHWGRVMHVYVKKTSPWLVQIRACQSVILANAGLLLMVPGTNFSKIRIKIQQFSLTEMSLKKMSAKWPPLCLDLNVIWTQICHIMCIWDIWFGINQWSIRNLIIFIKIVFGSHSKTWMMLILPHCSIYFIFYFLFTCESDIGRVFRLFLIFT